MKIAENSIGNVALVLEVIYDTDESDVDSDEEDTTPEWCDLRTETETKLEANQEGSLKDSHGAGISISGRSVLETMLRKYLYFTRALFYGLSPATFSP